MAEGRDTTRAESGGRPLWIAAAPAAFVLLWASGFPVSKLGLEHTQPFTLLTIRSIFNVLLVTAAIPLIGIRWPRTWRAAGHIAVSGVLLQSAYLGCIFIALGHGVSQGVVALVAGMQPLLTALFVGRVLGERVRRWQWAGFVLGFGGLALVVSERASLSTGSALGFAVAGLTPIFITAASLYQKRFCADMDLRSGMIIQHATAIVPNGAMALLIEPHTVDWGPQLAFALIWLIVFLSVGAQNLYYVLLRRGEAGRVSSLFYLTPPTAVVMGYLTYGETFGLRALAGFAVAAFGVALVTRSR